MTTIYKIQINIILVAMILLLGSCANDITQSGTDTNGEKNTLKFAFNIEQPRIVTDGNVIKTTRSMTTAQESVVNSISIVVFNTTGDKVGECYSTFSSAKTTTFYASVPVAVANSYKVYAVANASSAAIASMKAATTLTAFNAISETLSSADDLNSATSLVMFGKGTATLGNSNGVGSTTSISLSRLAAKITLNLTSSNNYTITDYQICSTPMSSFVSSDNLSTTNISGTNYNAKNTFNGQTAVSGLTVKNASTSANIFMYENMAGVNSASKAPALRISGNAPSTAAYVIVNATSSDYKTYQFRYYFGGTSISDYTNFDVKRNTNYTYNINISGVDYADLRCKYKRGNVLNYIGDATIGNYLYSDGTNGTTFKSGQTVGIIYSSELTQAQYNAGCRHGRVLALKNANGGGAGTWGSGSPYTDRTGHPYVSDFKSCFQDVSSGYDALSANSSYVTNTNNYAWYYCKTYSDGTTHSGDLVGKNWYLPSAGDWWDIMENLGTWSASDKTTLTTNRSSATGPGNYIISTSSGSYFSSLNTKLSAAGGDQIVPSGSYPYYFWSASESGSSTAVPFNFDSVGVGLSSLDKTLNFYYRAVLAF